MAPFSTSAEAAANEMLSNATIHIGAERARAQLPTDEDEAPKSFIDKANEWVEDHTSPISSKDMMLFYRMLASLANAGITLTQSLEIIVAQTENLRFRRILGKVSKQVSKGKSLSEALTAYPKLFGKAQIGMIESGEISGKLNHVCAQMAIDTEKAHKMGAKIKGAMTYPIVVVVVVILVVGVVMTLVIPKLSDLFSSAGKELPVMTQVMIAVSNFLIDSTLGIPHVAWVLLGIIGFWFGAKAYINTPLGKSQWDTMLLHLPIVGPIVKKIAVARFTRSLANLLTSGIAITRSLRINAETVGNDVYRQKILLVADDVERGLQIHQSIDASDLFPPLVVNMVAVGERIAELGMMSGKIADFYEEEVDDTMNNLSKILEPVIIVFVALLVGTIAIAIMQPIMQIASVASGQ